MTRSGWHCLPELCLLQIFRYLGDHDRTVAVQVCHHWHDVMFTRSLWRSRKFYFSGRLSPSKRSEAFFAVAYAHQFGVYLENLYVSVDLPKRYSAAKRVAQAIRQLLTELARVDAPLQSLSLVRLRLYHSIWYQAVRKHLVDDLIGFLLGGSLKLTAVCLREMQLPMIQGMEVLSALLHSQRHLDNHDFRFSLDLEGFFSPTERLTRGSHLPHILGHLPHLTELRMSYSCLTEELLMALRARHDEEGQNTYCDGSCLQSLSLDCSQFEHHHQVVSDASWASLASCCPNMKVKLAVFQIIETNSLTKILQPDIPLIKYKMNVYLMSDQSWNAKPLLCELLPPYRHSLQYLTLDFTCFTEPLDDDLLELVKVCERVVILRIHAFLEVNFVKRLLPIRWAQRSSRSKTSVNIYTRNDNVQEMEVQLYDALSSMSFPPELRFFAAITFL